MNGFLRIRTVGILAVAFAAMACDDPVSRACTLIGCSDGLDVQLEGALPSSYTIAVEVPGSAHPWVVECTTESPCGENVHFPDFTPDVVRVTVESDTVSKTETFQVDYETVRPNGPDCPPECLHGTVVFEW